MASSNLLEYLDKAGVQTLAKSLLEKVNIRIADRIVTSVDSYATNDNVVPTAKAVYTAIQSGIAGMTHLSFQTVTGNLQETVTQPSESVMYLQRDSEDDPTWILYIYKNSQWVAIGDTSIDLQNYWAKTATTEMKTALGIDDLEESLEELETKVDDHIESITKLTDEDITGIVSTAFSQTAVELNKE